MKMFLNKQQGRETVFKCPFVIISLEILSVKALVGVFNKEKALVASGPPLQKL